MPRATFNPDDTIRFNLKSLPDGYVVIRRHMYGNMLKRRQMGIDTQIAEINGERTANVTMNVATTTAFDFAHCVVEHNLEDEAGNTLNFNNAGHVAALMGPVGDEISAYIDQMNTWDSEELPK